MTSEQDGQYALKEKIVKSAMKHLEEIEEILDGYIFTKARKNKERLFDNPTDMNLDRCFKHYRKLKSYTDACLTFRSIIQSLDD